MLKIIKAIILFLLIFFIILIFSLFWGIKIDSFSLGNFSVSKFYLKLDKKLILKTQNLVIHTKNSKKKSSIKDVQQLLSNLEYLLILFDKIEVKELKINDNLVVVDLDRNHLFIDNKYVNISSDLEVENNIINLNLYSLYLKDMNLTFFGDIKIDLKKESANFLGEYIYKNVEGSLKAQADEDFFDFDINVDKQIDSISFLKDFFRLDETAEEWMYDNVTGKIKLNYLKGRFDLKKQRPVINSIKGQAIIQNAKIRFHKGVKTVDTPKLTVNYSNDTLSFDLDKPMYSNSKLYGSRVYITNLTSLKKGIVHVSLKSDSILDENILEILRAYDIKLPIKQLNGNLDSELLLEIPYLASKKMHAKGSFKVEQALLNLGTFEFFANNADVVLNDNIVTIEKSSVEHKDMLNANLQLKIDTSKKEAEGKVHINSFEIKKEKEELISLKDFDTNLNIDFKNKTTISLEKLLTKLQINEDSLNINIPKLSIAYPYSGLLRELNLKKGDLKIDIYDENNINFDANVKDLTLPLEKNGQKIKDLNVNGVVKNDVTFIQAKNYDINIVLKNGKKPLLKLKDIDLLLYETTNDSSKKEYPNVDIQLNNSLLKLDKEHIYKILWANLYLNNSKVDFEGEGLNLDLPISKDGERVSKLLIDGSYEKSFVNLKTKDKKLQLSYDLSNEKIKMFLENYDVIFNMNDEDEGTKENTTSYYIEGKNSNIIIDKKHIAKATKYNFIFEKNFTEISLNNKSTTFFYRKDKNKNIIVDAKNMNDEFLNALLGKGLIKDGNVNLSASGKDDLINGTISFTNSKIVDLAILNNLIILINTSPAIINPFLAIPSVVGMATSGGFNLNGYRIIDGKVEFSYDFKKKFLDMKKIHTEGNGIDFDGFLSVDFVTSAVDGKLKLIFFKDYSKIVNYIPVINYVLLGDKKRVDTEVTIYGTLEEPKYKTNLVEEGVSAPINVLKRIFTSPIDLIKSLGGIGDDKEEEEKKEE
ncbi:AsmA family protein (DUF3971 domain) [Halarcobacter anaerophilus]|nr:AsmA family protein (DUF3971 domain) [Halarcobacter anaerophilus]